LSLPDPAGDRIRIAALATWIAASAGGLYLLSIWQIEYDKEFQAASGAGGPVGESGQTAPARPFAVLSRPLVIGPPERNFPLPVVIGHGLFAGTTIALVLLTALGVGGG
jgi:hypothetical protein